MKKLLILTLFFILSTTSIFAATRTEYDKFNFKSNVVFDSIIEINRTIETLLVVSNIDIISGRASFNHLIITNSFVVSNDATIHNLLTANKINATGTTESIFRNLKVTNNASFTSNLFAENNFINNLIVSNNSAINGNLTTISNIYVGKQLFANDLTVSNNAILNGDLTTLSNIYVGEQLFANDLTVSNDTTIKSNVYVGKQVFANDLTISNNASIVGNLNAGSISSPSVTLSNLVASNIVSENGTISNTLTTKIIIITDSATLPGNVTITTLLTVASIKLGDEDAITDWSNFIPTVSRRVHTYPFATNINLVGGTNYLIQAIEEITNNCTINLPVPNIDKDETIRLTIPAIGTNTVTFNSLNGAAPTISTTNINVLLLYSPWGTNAWYYQTVQ